MSTTTDARSHLAAKRRQALAWAAGFSDWESAIRATAHLSQELAGHELKVTHATIFNWRAALGVPTLTPGLDAASKAEAFRADPADPRHSSPNGYKNLRCRCAPCREAWTTYLRERRHAARAAELAVVS